MPSKTFCFSVGIVLASLFSINAAGARAAEVHAVQEDTYETAQVFKDLSLDGAYRLTPYGSGFLLLDRFNHRLLELDSSGSTVRQFGQVGQAPGELRLPMDYSFGGADTIRVVTHAGLFAIHSFASDGRFLEVVHQGDSPEEAGLWSSFTVAVDSRDRFYLNQPRWGSVLTRYSPRGDKQAALGELLKPGDVFPDCERHNRCRDRRFAVRLNRVAAVVTPGDSVVTAFSATPVVRAYSATGELEFETRLRSGLVAKLVSLSMREREAWAPYITVNVATDGIQALTVVHGVAVDPRTGLIYCLVGGREIHVLDAGGAPLAVFRPSTPDVGFGSIAVDDGVAWLAGYSKLHRAELPIIRHVGVTEGEGS